MASARQILVSCSIGRCVVSSGAVQGAGATIFDGVTLGQPLNRLTAVIAMENLAAGLLAPCTSRSSHRCKQNYAAMQYALLSSLALLVGVIFRPRIGAFVDAGERAGLARSAERFAEVVFIFAHRGIGLVAVLAALSGGVRAATKPR